MKLRKFFGLTSRSVLEQVRVELGPDAVIVANHATADGIEVTALASQAMDSILSPAPAGSSAAATPAEAVLPPPEPARAPAHRAEPEPWRPQGQKGAHMQPPAAAQPAIRSAPVALPEPVAAPAPLRQSEAAVPASQVVESNNAAVEVGHRVIEEVAAMRELIEERLALLAFSDTLRRRPLAARATADLLASGYSAALAREVTARLPADFGPDEAQKWLIKVLSRNLRTVRTEDEIVMRGGTYALVGPTGVGKTTTTAKLAARCVLRYGAGNLGLITTDGFRIGAHDQLRIYAKILGVSVHTVSDVHDLNQAMEAVRGRHLVLIDTVGIGQRDARVAEQAQLLAQPSIRKLLLLNSTSQGDTLDEVVAAYRGGTEPDTASAFAGCIVTKVDESSRLGTVLDVAIRHKLAIHYLTNGQRVPEDIFIPEGDLVVRRSLRARSRPSAFSLEAEEIPLALNSASLSAPGAIHA